MNTIRLDSKGDIDAIVDDERDLVFDAYFLCPSRDLEELGLGTSVGRNVAL